MPDTLHLAIATVSLTTLPRGTEMLDTHAPPAKRGKRSADDETYNPADMFLDILRENNSLQSLTVY